MKNARILSLNRSKFLEGIKVDLIPIVFTLLFITSLMTGCLLVKKNPTDVFFTGITSLFVGVRENGTFFTVFGFSLLVSFVFVLAVYLSGTSFVGLAFIPLLIFFRGMIYGITSGELYILYGFNGVAYNLLIVIPSAVISVMCLICAAEKSVRFSYCIGRFVLLPGERPANPEFRLFIKYLLYFLIICIIAAFCEALLSVAFLKYFELEVIS